MPAVTATPPRVPARPPAVRRRRSVVPRLLLAGLVAVVMVLLLAAGAVVSSARQYDDSRSDALVVLGAAQYGGEPSPVLANRLEYAAELYRDGVAPFIITVGGGMPGDRTTEAESGSAYLQRLGVPSDAIVAIPKGRDTLTSLAAVANRADREGWGEVTVVSDRAHLARSSAIMSELGFRTHSNGPAMGDGALLTPEYVARESLGLVRFHLWDRWHLAGDRS